MSKIRLALLLALPLVVVTGCGSSPCECDACDEALEVCDADDQDCEDAAVALCDAAGNDDDSSAR